MRHYQNHKGGTLTRLSWVPVLLIGMLVVFSASVAQDAESVFDSQGKLFWVTFLEGWGGGGATERPDMRLYLSAVEPTTVTITDNRNGSSVTVEIPQAFLSVEVDVTELFGEEFELGEENLGLSRKSLKIEADVDLGVYGVTTRIWSSDAFLALPDDVLSRRYIVLAYPNGLSISPQPFVPPEYDHPSEFAFVATADNTTVTIEPTANINGRPTRDPITVVLNAGEVFFGQAMLDGPQDVTGTQIRSDKPIALFSGTRRTAIPTSVGNFRDLLVEQMPPLDSWGVSVILTPVATVGPVSRSFDPVARIVAHSDSTAWRRDGIEQTPLNAGEPVEIVLDENATVIDADGPILVAQYEHSNQVGFVDDFGLGDPFMMVVPPYSQFDTLYSFQSVPHQLFTRHFVNVVVETTDTSTFRLDGREVGASYIPIHGTPYSYAQIELSPGAHRARAGSPFGLYVYGFGEANSYGYPGGMLFNLLNSCGDIVGVVRSDRITGAGIEGVDIDPMETANVSATILDTEPGSERVRFRASLVNPYRDGMLSMDVTYEDGRQTDTVAEIPGFTIGLEAGSGGLPLRRRTPIYNGQSECVEVVLVNYGRYPRTIDRLKMEQTGGSWSTDLSGAVTLAPGERRNVQICFDGLMADSVVRLEASVGDSCVTRTILYWEIVSIVDTLPPSRLTGECRDGAISIRLEEESREFFGIESLRVVDTVNARVRVSFPAGREPTPIVDIDIEQINPYEDVIYHVTATDAAGNVLNYRDTLGGFTLAALDRRNGLQATVRRNQTWGSDSLDYLGRRCDSVMLINYGSTELRFEQATLVSNREYSLPPAQFPLLIGPGDTLMLELCLEGRFAGLQSDTILIEDRCGRQDRIPLRTPVDFGFGSGVDECGQELNVRAFAPARKTFLETPFPNPSNGDRLGVDFGLQQGDRISLDVLDATGVNRLRLINDQPVDEGVHRLSFDPSLLKSGSYFCRLTTSSGEVLTSRFIIQQ